MPIVVVYTTLSKSTHFYRRIQMKKLSFIVLSLLALSSYASSFQLQETTITKVHQAIKAKKLSCEQLVQLYQDRIRQYNFTSTDKPPLNAYISLNPYALAQAKQLDQDYAKTKKFKGPLFCVPVIVKDNIDTVDTPSTSGSLSLLGSQPIEDAFLVKKLKQAGAIILGKGSMDEYASGMSSINSRVGRTGNAYDTTKNPGGSSAGPAAAVSANLALVGIGTDNSGSVRVPAAFNGNFGLRPSTGVISQIGIFPRGNLDGVAGLITRKVEDLAKVLDAIDVPDKQDPKTQGIPRPASYLPVLSRDALKGKRIGIVTNVSDVDIYAGMPKNTALLLKNTEAKLTELGATIVPNIKLPDFNTNRDNNMAGETEEIDTYLKSFPSTRQSNKDICDSNRTRIFGDNIKACLKFIADIAPENSQAEKDALNMFDKNRDYVHAIMKENKLDALLLPINSNGPASYDIKKVNTWRAAISSNAGIPAITLIAGYENNLPVSIELIAKQYQEAELIGMAYAYEYGTEPRRVPRLEKIANNDPVLTMSIAEINNFLSLVGYNTYYNFLINHKRENLSPEKFMKIYQQTRKETSH